MKYCMNRDYNSALEYKKRQPVIIAHMHAFNKALQAQIQSTKSRKCDV